MSDELYNTLVDFIKYLEKEAKNEGTPECNRLSENCSVFLKDIGEYTSEFSINSLNYMSKFNNYVNDNSGEFIKRDIKFFTKYNVKNKKITMFPKIDVSCIVNLRNEQDINHIWTMLYMLFIQADSIFKQSNEIGLVDKTNVELVKIMKSDKNIVSSDISMDMLKTLESSNGDISQQMKIFNILGKIQSQKREGKKCRYGCSFGRIKH